MVQSTFHKRSHPMDRQALIKKEAEGIAVSILDAALAKRGKSIYDISAECQRKVVTKILDQFPNLTRLAEKIVATHDEISNSYEI